MKADPLLLAVMTSALFGACAEHAAPSRAEGCDAAAGRTESLLLAGSGANLAPVRWLTRQYRERFPNARIAVAESIGTGGAIRALLDGAIDIGLASRPLHVHERARGIVAYPLAEVALVVAAHRDAPLVEITPARLIEIYEGALTSWPDNTPVVPLLRQTGDSATRAVEAALPGLGRAMAEAARRQRGRICYTDQQMRDALVQIPGAIGFLDAGTIALERLPVVVGRLTGEAPSAGSDHHPLLLSLSLLTTKDLPERAKRFIDFAATVAKQELVDAGYRVPTPPAEGN